MSESKHTSNLRKKRTATDYSHAINESGDFREAWRIFRIMAEFVEGYQFLSKMGKEVTVLGSARINNTDDVHTEGDEHYEIARKLGHLLGSHGFTTITGGGPGIMEAANRGAFEAGGKSVGLNIQLPFEQRINPYVNESTAFYYFFTRKVMLTSPANAFAIFPGGFGTMDEFFEIVDLMELGKMGRSPIILVGTSFWTPLIDFLKSKASVIGGASLTEIESWSLVDTADDAFACIKQTADARPVCELSPDSFQCGPGVDWKIFRIMAELVEGFDFLTGIIENVTVFGSNTISQESSFYSKAYDLGGRLSDQGFSVMTGGGAGIMEAANKGCFERGGQSIGINMRFGSRERINPYVKRSIGFQFPFTRKLIITAPSKAFVFFPGGFGTLHQLFEILTLIQTGKMEKVPVILVGHEYWEPLHAFIKKSFVHRFETIADEDDEWYQIVDTVDAVMEIIADFRKVSVRVKKA